MSYDVAKKALDETKTLQKARRDFAQLQQDEEKYLQEREEKEKARLTSIQAKIGSASSLLDSVTEKAITAIKNYQTRFSSFVKKLDFVLGRSDDIIDSAVALRQKAEKLYDTITSKYVELQKFEGELGKWDRELAKREEKVKKLNLQADKKLQDALQLADWAHNSKRYTIKRKDYVEQNTKR